MSTKDFSGLCRNLGIDPFSQLAAIESARLSRSKYGSTVTEVDGIKFDSAAEARHYQALKIAEQAGVISNLELQPRYLLQDAFIDASGARHRKMEYVADFRFVRGGKTVVVDVKGMKTQVYRLKRKLFQAKYPDVEFEEWR